DVSKVSSPQLSCRLVLCRCWLLPPPQASGLSRQSDSSLSNFSSHTRYTLSSTSRYPTADPQSGTDTPDGCAPLCVRLASPYPAFCPRTPPVVRVCASHHRIAADAHDSRHVALGLQGACRYTVYTCNARRLMPQNNWSIRVCFSVLQHRMA
ncbi:hypothetical protein C8R47DRAFT_1259583, partial [Mycena vitilis]